MASKKPPVDPLGGFLNAGNDGRRRRRVEAVPGRGPSGPAMSGGPSGPAMRGPSGPAMSGGPSGPAMSGGPAADRRRRRGGDNDELLKQLYG